MYSHCMRVCVWVFVLLFCTYPSVCAFEFKETSTQTRYKEGARRTNEIGREKAKESIRTPARKAGAAQAKTIVIRGSNNSPVRRSVGCPLRPTPSARPPPLLLHRRRGEWSRSALRRSGQVGRDRQTDRHSGKERTIEGDGGK